MALNISDGANEIITNMVIGQWTFEITETSKRLKVDNVARRMMECPVDMTDPEELFQYWESRIDPEDFDCLSQAIGGATRGVATEVEYHWNHPWRGYILLRCFGRRDTEVTDCVRLDGCVQILDGVEHIKTQKELEKEELERTRPFSELFMTSYVAASYVNLVDCTQIVYRTDEFVADAYSHVTNYVEGLTDYINGAVDPEDRQAMLQAVQPMYMRLRLMEKKEYSVIFRDNSRGVPHYYRFQAFRGLDPDHAAICFTDIDEEIHRKEELEVSGSVIKSLATDYEVVFTANFDTLDSHTYYRSESFASMVGAPRMKDGNLPPREPDYRARINMLGHGAVHPDDRENFFKSVSEDKLRDDMEKGNTIVIEFRIIRNGEIRHMQGRIVPNHYYGGHEAVFGIRDVENEYRAHLLAQAQELERQRVLEALAGDFACVHYVELHDNAEDDQSVIYRLSSVLSKEIPEWAEEKNFGKKMQLLESIVHPDDREYFHNMSQRDVVIENLKEGLSHYIICRLMIGDRDYFYQTKYVGEIQDGKVVAVVAGIRDMDASIRKQMRQNEDMERKTRSYAMLHDMIRSGMWSIDYDEQGEVSNISWSDEFRKMLGYQSEEDFPNTFEALAAIIHPDYVNAIWPAVVETVSDRTGSKIFDFRAIIMTKDRGYRWFRATGNVLRNNDGSPVQFFGIFIDINDQEELKKLTQERIAALEGQVMLQSQLAKEKDHIKMLHDIIHSAMWSMEFSGRGEIATIDWSDDFRKMLGFTSSEDFPNELQSLTHCLYAEDRERMLNHFWQAMDDDSREAEYDDEFRLVLKDGSVGWFHASGRIMRNLQTGEGSFYGTFVNTTTEHENAQMQMVIRGLTEDFACVCLVDLATGEDHIYHTSELYRLYMPGWDDISNFSDRLDRICESMVDVADRKLFIGGTRKEVILEELSKASSYVVTFRHNAGGRSEYWQAKFMFAEGYEHQLVAGFRNADVEIRKERERQEELMEAQKHAEDANEAKSKFLFNMSHDIRTPMNAIMGFSSMAHKYVNDPEKVVDCLGKIEVAGEHLLKLINDVLDMARIESGKVKLEESESNLIDDVEELVTILKEGAERSDLTLHVDTDGIRDRQVYADVLHVNQILLNILSNAVKYTKPGGKVDFTARQLDCDRQGFGTYEFVVTDTGIGMSPDMVEHVFDSFVRAQSATVSGIQGTGLGMAIAKQLTEQMGGSISVTSELDVGTTVTLRLTLRLVTAKKDAEAATLASESRQHLAGKRILLVEDNELNREIAMDILTDEGLILDEADDGTVAVDIMKRVGPDYYDAILMDIQMPTMDGYHATQAIRALTNADYSRIPIIAMTANAFEEDKQKALESGMNEHLPKPIKVAQVMEMLARFIG